MGRVLPILFNTDMVQSILDGEKTTTRRCVKFLSGENPNWTGYIKDGLMLYNGRNEPCCQKPPYKKGDILYVRETWAFQCCIDCMNLLEDESCMIEKVSTIHEDKDADSEGCYIYRVDHPHPERIIWRPSIHMPKEAARIWLKVTDVRVERLQDITEEQAKAEGINGYSKDGKLYKYAVTDDWWIEFHRKHKKLFTGNWWQDMPKTAKEAFSYLWNSTINKKILALYGYDANPWVWVIEFERCEKPESEG